MNVHDIENAIRQLSEEDFERIVAMIDKYRAEVWDRQIATDILAGRLDRAGRRVDVDFDAGRCREI